MLALAAAWALACMACKRCSKFLALAGWRFCMFCACGAAEVLAQAVTVAPVTTLSKATLSPVVSPVAKNEGLNFTKFIGFPAVVNIVVDNP